MNNVCATNLAYFGATLCSRRNLTRWFARRRHVRLHSLFVIRVPASHSFVQILKYAASKPSKTCLGGSFRSSAPVLTKIVDSSLAEANGAWASRSLRAHEARRANLTCSLRWPAHEKLQTAISLMALRAFAHVPISAAPKAANATGQASRVLYGLRPAEGPSDA